MTGVSWLNSCPGQDTPAKRAATALRRVNFWDKASKNIDAGLAKDPELQAQRRDVSGSSPAPRGTALRFGSHGQVVSTRPWLGQIAVPSSALGLSPSSPPVSTDTVFGFW